MIYQSATAHAKKIQAGEYSSEDVTKAYYERIADTNDRINAIVINNQDAALSQARVLDEQLKQGKSLGPLHGVPVTIKECFKMVGTKTTINYPPLKNYIATEDSIIVQRLKSAGAVILGKTNVPTLLSDSQTFGPLYPTCNNPWDLTRVPGGSTGGGAAAVASGMTTFEIGSDIGGSIRNPSHYCGLFGLKPTQNGHGQDGHVPPLPGKNQGFATMNSTGPLARTVSDIELAYDTCYQPRWDYQRYLPIDIKRPKYDALGQYKVAYFDELLGFSCGSETKLAIDKLKKTIEAAGGTVEKITLDTQLVDRILKGWARLFGFVAGQDFNWFMRQGMRMMFGKDLKGSHIDAKRALTEGLSLNFKAFSNALYEQQACIAEFSRYFEDYDFILSPTSAGPAFEHNHKHKPILLDGEHVNYVDYAFLFVMPYNLMGNPVLTVPTGPAEKSGLPIGISIAAPLHAEQALIHYGKLIEAAGYQFKAPPL